MLLSANELGFKPKMIGGAMVGLQATAFKDKLKSKLNGVVNYENWVPSPKMMAPAADFFKKYQARAPRLKASIRSAIISAAGVTPICRCWPQAVDRHEEHRRRQARRLPARPRVQHHHGGRRPVRQKRRMDQVRQLQVQYHDLTDAANLDTWRGMSYQTVLTPADEKTGSVIYPYEKALK